MHARMLWWCLTAVVLSLASTDARACQCAGSPKPCEAFWQTDAVFTGTVKSLSVISVQRGDATFKYATQQHVVRLQIADIFRGELVGSEVEVITGMGGGDCGYHFERGKQYLVYASKFENQLHTGICTRTRLLSKASDDLKFFYNMPAIGSGSIIAGSVQSYLLPLTDDERFRVTPLSSVKVTVDGHGKHLEAETDREGKFEFTQLEPGTYKVRAALPPSPRNYGDSEVTVVDRGCAYLDFVNRPGVNISGKVVDPSGKAAAGLKIDLINANETMAVSPKGKWRFTTTEGRYGFENVPPGDYLLGINLINSRDSQCPPRIYFPGVADSSAATLITIKEGEDLNDLNIKLLPDADEVEIEGTVLWLNGTPATHAAVSLNNGIMNRQTGTDSTGRFVVKGVAGCTYQLMSFTYGVRIGNIIEEMRHSEPLTLTLMRQKQPPLKLVLTSPGFMHRDDEPKSPR
jgi:hypothetical protein